MKIYKDATLNEKGNYTNVFECEVCGNRSRYEDRIIKCEKEHRREYHEEEAQAGIL